MPHQRFLLIRAVNVGGASLPMSDLRDLLTGLGAADVRTYIASGNALVTIEGDPDAFDRAVEKAVEQRFGYFRECISRERGELEAALVRGPAAGRTAAPSLRGLGRHPAVGERTAFTVLHRANESKGSVDPRDQRSLPTSSHPPTSERQEYCTDRSGRGRPPRCRGILSAMRKIFRARASFSDHPGSKLPSWVRLQLTYSARSLSIR